MATELPIDPDTFRPAGKTLSRRESAALRALGRKWCPKCAQALPLAQFYRCPSRADGCSTICRTCRAVPPPEITDPDTFRPAGLQISPLETAALRALGRKWCPKCAQALPLAQFSVDAGHASGLRGCCRACVGEYLSSARSRRRERWADADPYADPSPKACPRCSRELPRAEFDRDASQPDGIRSYCRTCGAERGASDRARLRARWAEDDPYSVPSEKTCVVCRRPLPRTEFYRHSAKADGLRTECKSCSASMDAARRAKIYDADGIDPVDRLEVFRRDVGRCYLCSLDVNPVKWHLDHIHALANGGEHALENVAVTHPACNESKGAKEWPDLGTFDPQSPLRDPAPAYPRGVMLVTMPDGSVWRGAERISAETAAVIEDGPAVPDLDEIEVDEAA